MGLYEAFAPMDQRASFSARISVSRPTFHCLLMDFCIPISVHIAPSSVPSAEEVMGISATNGNNHKAFLIIYNIYMGVWDKLSGHAHHLLDAVSSVCRFIVIDAYETTVLEEVYHANLHLEYF